MKKIIKNNKKGFTLIELLAVIIIISIIAVITVPMIMNVIDKAKLGALEDSAYGIVESANLYYSTNIQNGLDTIEFTCDKNGCINEDKKLNYKGTIDSGKVKIYSDGKISVCIEDEKNAAIKKANDTKVISSTGSCNTTNDEYSIDEVVSLNKYNEIKEKYNALIDKGNANADEIIKDKSVIVKGEEIKGTMPNNGNITKTLNAGEEYIVPLGYTSGGKITSTSLASQTASTSTASTILNSYTAYVNGNKLTGSMTNNAGKTLLTAFVSSDASNTYFTVPSNGYYTTTSKISTSNSNIKKFPNYINSVIYGLVSNGNSSNIQTGSWTASADGVIAYSCASANASGSRVYATLNNATLQDVSGPINLIAGNISVKKGDVIYLYAYGVKANTSNSSAYIIATFGAY